MISQSNPQSMFCTYMQNSQNNQNIQFANQNFKMRQPDYGNHSSTDVIYASFSGLNRQSSETQQRCQLDGEVSCYGENQCILQSKWCDSIVDCSDGSDESACSCKNRLSKARICDGYADCPVGEDEVGCFECAEFMFSCYYSIEEFIEANRSTISMCYSSLEKCDGFNNCLNGKDEVDCNIIMSENLENPSTFGVSYTEGFLYRNYKGQWYPVCNNALKWADEACIREIGINTGSVPSLKFVPKSERGPFIEPSKFGGVQFPQSCQKQENNQISDHLVYVECPKMVCGISTPLNPNKLRKHRKSLDYIRNKREHERIVGGIQSKPLQWPFIIAIFRDGHFHCGGIIHSEKWVNIKYKRKIIKIKKI